MCNIKCKINVNVGQEAYHKDAAVADEIGKILDEQNVLNIDIDDAKQMYSECLKCRSLFNR